MVAPLPRMPLCVTSLAVVLGAGCGGDGGGRAPVYGGGDGLRVELGQLREPADAEPFEGSFLVPGANLAELRRPADAALVAKVLVERDDPILLRVRTLGSEHLPGAAVGDAPVVLLSYEDWFDEVGRLPQAVLLEEDASLRLRVGNVRWSGAWEESGATLNLSASGLEGEAVGLMRFFPESGDAPARTQSVQIRWTFDEGVSARERRN